MSGPVRKQKTERVSERKIAVNTVVCALGAQREGAAHSFGVLSGILGEEKAFMEKVSWRSPHIGVTPTPRSGRDTSGLPGHAH